MNFKITTNAVELTGEIKRIAEKQIPFVTAQTLTNLAFLARDKERNKLDQYFNVRTRWSRSSMKAVRAEKRDWPHSFSVLGVRDKVLALNITGGEREGNNAVPGRNARKILNPGRETLGPKFFPGKLIQKGDKTDKGTRTMASGKLKSNSKYKNKPFMFTSKKTGEKVIAIRRSKDKTPLDVLYVFKKDPVIIPKHWPLISNTSDLVRRLYTPLFAKNLGRAIKPR